MTLLFTDSHIEQKALPELENIFNEIISYNADELIFLGDYYNKNRPSPEEIYFGTKWAAAFMEKFKAVVFLRGTASHDREGECSAIDYLFHLGITPLNQHIDDDHNLFGHFFTEMSKFEYGTHKHTLKELTDKYNQIFLGHLHLYQELKENQAWHIGSCRWQHWNEIESKEKYLVLLDKKPQFIPIKSAIPMISVTNITEIETINANTKVQWVVSNFKDFVNGIDKVKDFKNKFVDFKIKQEFTTLVEGIKEKPSTKNKSVIAYINEIKDEQVKKLLLEVIK